MTRHVHGFSWSSRAAVCLVGTVTLRKTDSGSGPSTTLDPPFGLRDSCSLLLQTARRLAPCRQRAHRPGAAPGCCAGASRRARACRTVARAPLCLARAGRAAPFLLAGLPTPRLTRPRAPQRSRVAALSQQAVRPAPGRCEAPAVLGGQSARSIPRSSHASGLRSRATARWCAALVCGAHGAAVELTHPPVSCAPVLLVRYLPA